MKALVKEDGGSGFSYLDIPKPSPGPGEVLIRVEAAAICGTDRNYWTWNEAARGFSEKFGLTFPFVAGHECAGVVVELGEGVSHTRLGDRVALETHIPCGSCYQCQTGHSYNCSHMKVYGTSCDGCFAEYAVAPERVVFHLPDSVSFEEGALFEPAGVAMRAVEEAQLEAGDVVMVSGCGAIGLLAIEILLACGAGKVLAVDIDKYKLGLAKKLGAIPVNSVQTNVRECILSHTGKRGGADVILETSGSGKAYDTLFECLRLEGRVVTVGHPGAPISINITQSVNLKGASIKGVFGRRIWETWWKLASLVEAKKIDLLQVVTHRYPLSSGNEAFYQMEKGAGKILYFPQKNV